MENKIISSLEEYIQFIEKLPMDFTLSRGQYKEFPLLPAALRLDEEEKRLYSNRAIEGFLEEFYNYSHLYINEEYASFKYSSKNFQTMIWAQHYGIPTQLLDFTSSHLVSLMFAVEDAFKMNEIENAVVWFLNPTELNYVSSENVSREIKNISNSEIVRSDYDQNKMPSAVTCVKSNKRVQAQNGDFVYFRPNDLSLETYPDANRFLRKIIIPSHCVRTVLISLYRCGMRPSHL